VEERPDLEITGEAVPLRFDEDGRLEAWDQ
jgi:hypothetical protein